MSGVRLEVQWSPIHTDKFITWGTEIFLYEVCPLKESSNSSCVKLSDTTVANLLATNSNHQYVKCVDVYPQPEPDILLAIGQANGKVVLTTFGPTAFDTLGLTGRELVPRHARQCNTVAWNPVDSNLIAAGLDKYRADQSVLLWDVLKCPHHGTELARPVAELGLSEATHSLAWFKQQSRTLVVGMNNKHLKLVDFRDSNKAVNSTPTKAVYGLVVDPLCDHQLASFVDNQICIWDTRNFEKPVMTLSQQRTVSKVLWCPTRHNLLGSLQRESGVVHLHDVQRTVVNGEEVDPSVLERCVTPGTGTNLTSFSWHPLHENRLLAIALTGILTDYVVLERITLNWGPGSHLVWTQGRHCLEVTTHRDRQYAELGDIAMAMRRRALLDYGLKTELWENGDLAEDKSLNSLWHWLQLSRSLVDDGTIRCSAGRLPGVRFVLKLDPNQSNGSPSVTKSDAVCMPWDDVVGSVVKVFRSEEREHAMQLCGWKFDRELLLKSYIEHLQTEGAFSRAATLAAFHRKLRLASDILHQGALSSGQADLSVVAMALAGFTSDRSSMWRERCQASRSGLTDPYLRAMFGFLAAEPDNYDAVLNEKGVLVDDRVAFACTYLSDLKLQEYVRQLTSELVEEGELAGMLLTGTGTDGVQLLQRYLDVTGDVQSVSLLAVRSFPVELVRDGNVQVWLSSYRHLLDKWGLWNQRAQFDIEVLGCCPGAKPPPQQVFVSCNFCGKSISAQMQGLNRARGTFPRLGNSAQKLRDLKMSACPQCRKPLPRCAICLLHMGTASGLPVGGSTNSNGRSPSSEKVAEFPSWFTWCQSCRHGGHAVHMTHWFRDHLECPVTACTCRCLSLDSGQQDLLRKGGQSCPATLSY